MQGPLGIVILNFPLPHRPNLAVVMGQVKRQRKICSLLRSYFRNAYKQMRFQRTIELARRSLESL